MRRCRHELRKWKENGKLKLLIIVGTRPEIIRLAAIINTTRKHFDVILAHTGQNYDYNLNGVFFKDLKLEKDLVTMDKKKVLMVHNFYQIGGGEHTVFKNEVELLRKNGHEVIEYTRSNNELKTSKLKLVLLPLTTIWSWKTFWEVRRIIKKEKINIVHCHNTFPLISPSVYYAARSMNVPVIQTIHNFRFLCPNGSFFCDGKVCEKCYEKNSFKDAIKNNCYRNSKIQTLVLVAMLKFHRWIGTYKKISYIFLTDFNRRKFDKLININSEQVFIKENFVNSSGTKYNPLDKRVYVFVGRLDSGKGILNLVRMWNQLEREYELHIYGNGETESEIKKEIAESDNIKLFGFQPQAVVFEHLTRSTALITPYIWYEGFPMNIAECFSMGVPVVSSNRGNAAEIVLKANAGSIFDITSLNSLKNALDVVYENRELYSINGIAFYCRNLCEKENYKRVLDIYDKSRVIK